MNRCVVIDLATRRRVTPPEDAERRAAITWIASCLVLGASCIGFLVALLLLSGCGGADAGPVGTTAAGESWCASLPYHTGEPSLGRCVEVPFVAVSPTDPGYRDGSINVAQCGAGGLFAEYIGGGPTYDENIACCCYGK